MMQETNVRKAFQVVDNNFEVMKKVVLELDKRVQVLEEERK